MAQLDHKRNHVGIFGGSGTGKTTYGLRYITSEPYECVFIFDPEGEFSELLEVAPALTAEAIDMSIETGWVCFDPGVMFEGELEKAFDFFCDVAFQYAKENPGTKKIVVDELGSIIGVTNLPKPIKRIVQTGRRYGLDGVFLAQQPNEIHNYVRSQLSQVACFQLTDENALEFPKKFGFDEMEIRELNDYEWICRDNKGREARSWQ